MKVVAGRVTIGEPIGSACPAAGSIAQMVWRADIGKGTLVVTATIADFGKVHVNRI